MAKTFRLFLEQFFPLSDTDWLVFEANLISRTFSKNEIFLEVGQVENYVSFIEQGIVRYFIELEEKEMTFEIAFPESLASAYDSFLLQEPSRYNAQSLSHTVMKSISHANLQEVYAQTSAGNLVGRKASEELYLRKNKRQLSLLKDRAEKRYLDLLANDVRLVQQIPLKYLASYIGVTPQALSRIRKRISG